MFIKHQVLVRLSIGTVLVLCHLALLAESSRILIVVPHGTKSQQNMFVPLVKELAQRGHQLTVITNYESNDLKNRDNVRDIVLEQLAFSMWNVFDSITSTESYITKSLHYLQVTASGMMKTAPRTARETFSDARIKDLIDNDHFDLVMISEANPFVGYPLAWHFKAPIIMLSPNVLFPGRATSLGDGEHHSYAPFFFTRFSDRMTFMQRMANMLAATAFDWVHTRMHEPAIRSIVRHQLIPDCPPLYDMEDDIALVFTNTHPSFTYPRALPPQVIEVGGIHCRPAKPLPQDLETFVSAGNGNDAGFIIFAIGSAMKMDDMPEEMIQSFIQVFARLPQQVIWQWKGTPRNDLPKNVLPVAWLPQQDLLGHKGCRAFISHGGLNSLQEAIYHGVPILGLPFVTDHFLNIDRGSKDGYAIRLDWTDVSQETLAFAIQQLVNNPRYKDAAERLSSLFRDQLQPPLERAVYWTEFVLRHNGTRHLTLASRDLSLLQRQLVDVYLVLFVAAILLPFALLYFCLTKYCCFGSTRRRAAIAGNTVNNNNNNKKSSNSSRNGKKNQ